MWAGIPLVSFLGETRTMEKINKLVTKITQICGVILPQQEEDSIDLSLGRRVFVFFGMSLKESISSLQTSSPQMLKKLFYGYERVWFTFSNCTRVITSNHRLNSKYRAVYHNTYTRRVFIKSTYRTPLFQYTPIKNLSPFVKIL